MQGAGCSEAEGEENLTETLDVRERRKGCMHFVEKLRKENRLKKRTERDFSSQFIYLTK